MAANVNAKDILRDLKKRSPAIRTSDGKYKQAYSDAVWSLVETVIEENDGLRQHLEAMEDIAKATVNSAQLQVQQLHQQAAVRFA